MTSSTRQHSVPASPALRRSWSVRALLGWTVVLWVSRLRNVLTNDELDGTGTAVRVGVVVVFVGLAIGAFAAMRRGDLRMLWVLVVWTVGYWIVRGGGILVDDHSVGFKAIHTVLAVISLSLAARVTVGAWHRPLRSPDRIR